MAIHIDQEPITSEGESDCDISREHVDRAAERAGGTSFGWTIFAAAGSAVIGGVLLGLAEHEAASLALPMSASSGYWPWNLRAAAAGRIITTHLAVWTPLFATLGVGYWILFRRRARAAPVPFFLTLYVVTALAAVIPAGLELGHRLTPQYVIPIYSIGVGALVGVYWGGRGLRSRLGVRRFRRLFGLGTLIAFCGAGYFGGIFWISPLRDPGAARARCGLLADRRSDRPHVLWIVLDTVRADRLSVYGSEPATTPFLEEWARQSLVFERATANGMWTPSSHASMFTGLPLRMHGVGGEACQLEDRFETTAELLRDRGYATALFASNPLVSRRMNLAQGFETVNEIGTFQQHSRFALGFLFEKLGIEPPLPWLDRDAGAALTNQLLADWLDGQGARPAFVFLNYMEAHTPYRVPRAWREMFMTPAETRRSYALRRRAYGELEFWLNITAFEEGFERLAPSDRTVLKRQYLAALRYLDDRIREVIELFRGRGMLDNTIVIITSDHGEYLETHGMWVHQCLTYQDLIHVPLLLHGPGILAGRTDAPAQLSDLHPTIARAALGAQAARTTPYARDLLNPTPSAGTRIAVSEYAGALPLLNDRLRAKGDAASRHLAAGQIAALGPRYKLLVSLDGRRELYDLQEDPGELHDLIHERMEAAEELDQFVTRWQLTTPRYTPPIETEARSEAALQALRLLGYVESD